MLLAKVSDDLSSNLLFGLSMATLLTENKIKEFVSAGEVISDGSVDCAEGVKYDFRFGGKFLKASLERPVDYHDLPTTGHKDAKVDPGEVVFVMSQERLSLPPNIFVILSQKRKIAHDGIAVMGGLCVDPLYEGHLLVGLYNFSSSSFQLMPGKKLIAGMFYELDASEVVEKPTTPIKIMEFPEQLVKLIKSYQPVNVASISEQVSDIRREIDKINEEITQDRQWKKTFQGGLEQLLAALNKEKENRQQEFKIINERIDQSEN